MFRTLFAATLAAVASASPFMSEDDLKYRPLEYTYSEAAQAEIMAVVLEETGLTEEEWKAID